MTQASSGRRFLRLRQWHWIKCEIPADRSSIGGLYWPTRSEKTRALVRFDSKSNAAASADERRWQISKAYLNTGAIDKAGMARAGDLAAIAASPTRALARQSQDLGYVDPLNHQIWYDHCSAFSSPRPQHSGESSLTARRLAGGPRYYLSSDPKQTARAQYHAMSKL